MKLSLKIAAIFTVMTVLTIILYLVSSNIMVDYLYQGELTRITGISSGVINRIEGEKGKFVGKVKEYASILEMIEKLDDKNDVNFMEELGLYKKFASDGIEYKILIEPNLKIKQTYELEDKHAISEVEKVYIQELVLDLIDDDKTFIQDILSTEKHVYWIGISTLKNNVNNEIIGYFVGVKAIDQQLLTSIEESMGKNIKLVEELDRNRISKIQPMGDQELMLIYNDDNIASYYQLLGSHIEEEFYIRVTEPLVVKQETKRNIDMFTTILIALCIVINFILAMIIERFVVRRIVNINRGINSIKTSKNFSERIIIDQIDDEIGTLEKDINEMFDSLEMANDYIRSKEAKYSGVLTTMTNGFAYYRIERDEQGRILDAICEELNDALSQLMNVDRVEMLGKKFSEFINNTYIGEINLSDVLCQINDTHKPIVFNQIKLREDKWVDLTLNIIEKGYFTILVNDVSELKRFSEEMKYLAEYDSLTQLKNRFSLYQYLHSLKRINKPFVIYFMDLDNFKTLNDTVGHREGDKVLHHVANELMKLASSNVCIGRLGGDEFIVVREGVYDPTDTMKYGEDIIQLVNKRFEYALYNFDIKVSIGVSIYPQQALDVNTLLKYGDIAMYKSKHSGGNSVHIFTDTMMEELEVEASLKDAVKNEEFIPYYQPIYDIRNDKIIGAEALVRWEKGGEVIVPDRFIPIAKKTGDIIAIDYKILDKACEFCKQWRLRGIEEFTISVNMSYRSLKHPNCVEIIRSTLLKYNLNPSALKIEITEDEVLDYPQYIVKILNALKLLGVKIALDDFGVGYSSFNHIKMLPIDTLKIDRSLLVKIEDDNKSLAIVETLINLAHTLNLEVVCEGIEEKPQVEILRGIACDLIQGYYISQPLKEKLFDKCIEHYNLNKTIENII